MTDDNSILEAARGNDGPTMTDYLGSFISTIHSALDPSAIITPNAVRAFGGGQPQEPPPSQLRPFGHQQQSQQTPRREPSQPVRATCFRTKKSKFQFSKQHRSMNPGSTFMDVTTYRPQEQHAVATPAAASFTDDRYKQMETPVTTEDGHPMILLNASTLTMDMTDDDNDEERHHGGTRDPPAVLEEGDHPTAAKRFGEIFFDEQSDSSSMNPYDNLLRIAAKNTIMMAKMRDEVNQLRVQNAMLLNDLNMVSYDDIYSNEGMNMAA